MALRLNSLQMPGSAELFSSWTSQLLEIRNLLSPLAAAILSLALSTWRTVILYRLRKLFSLSPACIHPSKLEQEHDWKSCKSWNPVYKSDLVRLQRSTRTDDSRSRNFCHF